MPSYIVKSKNVNLSKKEPIKLSIGKFYSGDRFYTLLNEYIDINLRNQNIFVSWVIQILFKSSNFKHDPSIANGYPLSVKLFDWICIACLIVFIILTFSSLGTLIAMMQGKIDQLLAWVSTLGSGAIITGIPAIFWLWIYFTIRKKNKPLTLQAFVEKKISYCLKLRFLIKNIEIKTSKHPTDIILLENFEAQGAQVPRWLNIQMINLICSIFPHFNYVFKFDELSEEEYNDLMPIIQHDFRNIEIILWNNENIKTWKPKNKKKINIKKLI